MANHAGLKKVMKTVHTKKGNKRQTFWVKSSPKAAEKPKASKPSRKLSGKHVAGATAAFGALAAGAYALHRMRKAGRPTASASAGSHGQSSGMSMDDIAAFKKRGNSTHGLSGASFGGQRWGSGKKH